MNIPSANPAAFVHAHRGEIDAAIARVLDSGCYILGPEVEAFEHEFAAFLGVPHVIAVASGTDALWIALKSLKFVPGDEVITVALTASATVAAIVEAGARPVFVDVCADDLTLDPVCLAAALTPHTRAIVPVHLYGQAARMLEIAAVAGRAGIPIIEDCAQAHGALCAGQSVGMWGLAGAFSFYPTKNLGALGDGGALITSVATLAEWARDWRQYGWRQRFVSKEHGWNSRLDELQAAILRVRLRHLPADNARRAAIAGMYLQALAGSEVVTPAQVGDRSCVYHQFVVRHYQRDKWQKHLTRLGVTTVVHYPVPVHLQPAYQAFGHGPGSLPITEQASDEVFSLPIYPELSAAEVLTVCAALCAMNG